MSILSRIKGAMIADFEVPKPRRYLSGTCPWCHRPWTQDDADVHVGIDRQTGKEIVTHACGWVLSGSDIEPERIR